MNVENLKTSKWFNKRVIELMATGISVKEICSTFRINLKTMHRKLEEMRKKSSSKNTMEMICSYSIHKEISEIQLEIDRIIHLTPTGDVRNRLCDLNIKVLTTMQKFEL